MANEKKAAGFRRVLSPEETGIPALTAFGYADGAGAPLPVLEHRHRDKAEFILCASGMQRHAVCGLQTTVYAGEGIFIRPDEEHACLGEQPSKSKVFWLQIDLGGSGDLLGASGADAALLRQKLTGFSGRRIPVSEELLRLLGRAYDLFQSGGSLDRIRARALLLAGVVELLGAPALNQTLTPDIDRAKQYILLHIREQIDIDELLLASGLNMTEFREKFETQVGMSPRAYITWMKIERSKLDLQKSDRSDIDIAYRYHFPTVSVYRSQFKKVTGMSVRQYRKSCRPGK